MKTYEILFPGSHGEFPDEMERARYWADLLNKVIDKHDVYVFAKSNLDSNNLNSIRKYRAKKVLEEAVKRYEEIYCRRCPRR
jgi:hypothetical protein